MSGAIPDEFDIIVCGGGSCGCVVAGRFVSSVQADSLSVVFPEQH